MCAMRGHHVCSEGGIMCAMRGHHVCSEGASCGQ